ncbi:DMT family transporter [Desulfocurvus sp. DL9XJH121]
MNSNSEAPACAAGRPPYGISQGVLYVAMAAVFFSLGNALVKLAGKGLPSTEIVFGRSLFGVILCWWLMRRAGVTGLGRNKLALSLRGLLGAGGLLCSFYAFTHMPMADSVMLFYCNPFFAVVFAFLFLGERLDKRAAVCIPLCIVGVLLVTRPAFLFGAQATDIPAFVYAVGLASAAFAGGAYVCAHHLGGRDHALHIVLYLYLASLPISFAAMLPVWVTPNLAELAMLAGIGVLTQFAQLCMTKGLELESAGTATTAGTLQVVFSVFWGMVIFGEFPPFTAYVGAGLLILGSLILSGSIRLPRLHSPSC